jgi:hypothetical protein
MCLADAPSAPATPEPAAPAAPAAAPPDLELSTKTKRRSEEISSKAKGTKKYRVDSTASPNGLSGLNIPT